MSDTEHAAEVDDRPHVWRRTITRIILAMIVAELVVIVGMYIRVRMSSPSGPAVAWGITVAGAALMLVGIRSRHNGGEPWCRRCRGDLSRHWPEPSRCPSCGRLLELPIVSSGHRQRVATWIVAGAVLVSLMPQLQWWGGALAHTADRVNMQWAKPTAWVLHEFIEGEATQRQYAAAELDRRILSDSLTSEQAQKLLTHLLEADRVSHPAWVERLRRTGEVSLVQWRQYLARAAEVRLRPSHHASAGRGENIPVEVQAWVGPTTRLPVEVKIVSLEIAYTPVPLPDAPARRSLVASDVVEQQVQRLNQPVLRDPSSSVIRTRSMIAPRTLSLPVASAFDHGELNGIETEHQPPAHTVAVCHVRSDQLQSLWLTPGQPHPVKLTVDVAIYDPSESDPFSGEPVITQRHNLFTTLHWFSNRLLKAVYDPQLGEQLKAGISVSGRRTPLRHGSDVLIIDLRAEEDLPANFYCDVQVRANGRLYSAGHLAAVDGKLKIPLKEAPPLRAVSAMVEVPEAPDEVDVVLDCTLMPAGDASLTEVWAGKIEFTDVAVEDFDAELLRKTAELYLPHHWHPRRSAQ